MGKVTSKQKRNTILNLSSSLKENCKCPLCFKEFTTLTTYNQLNQHLYRCGNIWNKSKLITGNSSVHANDDIQVVLNLNASAHNKDDTHPKSVNRGAIPTFDFNSKVAAFKSLLKSQTSQGTPNITEIKAETVNDIFNQLKLSNLFSQLIITLNEGMTWSLNELICEHYINQHISTGKFKVINGKSWAFSFSDDLDWELVGFVISVLVIHDDIQFNYKLNSCLCKWLLDQKICWTDWQYSNIILYEELIKITHENDISSLDLTYKIGDDELIPDGDEIQVTNSNIQDYCDKVVTHEMEKYKPQINLIQKGLYKNIPKKEIDVFTGEEFYQIVNRMV